MSKRLGNVSRFFLERVLQMSENVSNIDGLSPKKRKAIEVLLKGGGKAAAADAAGVKIRTIDRWHNEPEFTAVLNDGMRTAVEGASQKMVGAIGTAVDTLVSIAKDENATDSVRLRASNMIIEQGLKLYEVYDISNRIKELENAIENNQTG